MISLINSLDCLSSSCPLRRLISAVGTSAVVASGAALGAGSMILKEYFLTELSGVRICLASYGEGAGLYTGAVSRIKNNDKNLLQAGYFQGIFRVHYNFN